MVAVVESAKNWRGHDFANRFCGAMDGSVAIQGKMTTICVVVRANVFAKDAFEMLLTKRDDVVGAFSSKGTNDSFAVSILPRAFWRTDNFLDAECLELIPENFAIDGITITMQKTWLFSTWESLEHLLRSPFSGWILSDVEMKDLSTVMGHDHEDVEDLER